MRSRRSPGTATRPEPGESLFDAQIALETLLGRLRTAAGATRVSVWMYEKSTEMVVPFRQSVADTADLAGEPEVRTPVTLSSSAFLSAVIRGQNPVEARAVGIHPKDMLSNLMPQKTKRRRVRIAEAKRLLAQEEAQKLIDMEEVVSTAVKRVENSGIVFLDEPTSGVDPVTRRQFWELIYDAAAGGTTVLVTTHYMDEAEYCDRISIMVAGRIGAIGTPTELKQQFGVESIDEVFVRLARPAEVGR